MKARRKGHTQIVAAAKAGISERSGRNIEQGKDRKIPTIQVSTIPVRRGARPDPLLAVLDSELKPMLDSEPALTAITLSEYLQNKYSDNYPDGVLRTLQRRVKQWQALHGPEKEVMFRQTYEAGRQGLSDFTKIKNVIIYIAGEPFNHLLYHFRLAFSR